MGVDYKAIAIIGIRVDTMNIPTTKKKIKMFNHNRPENMKFDPETGKELWKEIKIPEFDFSDNGNEWGRGIINIPNMRLYCGTDGYCKVYGFGIGDTNSNCGNDIAHRELTMSSDEIKAELKKVLEPLGVWDEKEFGLYTILYCSY